MISTALDISKREMSSRPVWSTSCHSLDATRAVLFFLYQGQSLPETPSSHTMPKTQRNEVIRSRYSSGETVPELAEIYGISQQRIHQILKGKRK